VTKRKLPAELPLESSNWVLLTKALELYIQDTGADDKLARSVFNQALKAKTKARRLRSQLRRADGHCELLTATAWDDDFLISGWVRIGRDLGSGKIRLEAPGPGRVFSRKLSKQPPGCWFYVWWPDYKNIFELVTPPAKPRTQPQEVQVERGRKRVHEWADLQSGALWLSFQRKQGAPPKTPTDVVNELREWCKRNKRKVPGPSTLYAIVAAAFRIKPTLKN
jgi:hypothetical protein